MKFHIAFQDPATVYAYSFMFVHHQVMWYMLIILGVVYWSFYRIIKEYSWNSFNKQSGILFLWSYSTDLLYNLEVIYNKILFGLVSLYHNYLVTKSSFWHRVWNRWWDILRPRGDYVPIVMQYYAYYSWTRIALTLHTLISYYSTIDNKNKSYNVNNNSLLLQELTLSKYWYYSAYSRSTNAYVYSYYNKESKDFLEVQSYRDNLQLELIWAFFPSLVIFLILIPSLYLLFSLEENLQPKFNIKVIGHQWFWSYEFDSARYDLSFEFDSTLILESDLPVGGKRLLEVSNRLYLPLNIPLRILVTSSDVLHSWAVPEMGIKVDAVPGRLNDCVTIIRRPGVFYGQCSELCGVGHGFMPIVVEACSYKKWMKVVQA